MTRLEERWASFRAEVVGPLKFKPTTIELLKQAFYAGASVVLVHGVPAPVEAGNSFSDEEAEQLNTFWAELVATMTIEKRH